MLNLHPLTIPDKLIHIEWKVLLAHFSSFVALHQQWQDLEAGRVPYTIFLPDPKVSVGFTTIAAFYSQLWPNKTDPNQELAHRQNFSSGCNGCRTAALQVLSKEREMQVVNAFLALAGHSVKQAAHFLVIPWSEAQVKKGLLPPH